MENEINWLSVIIASLTPLVIGSLYYHRAVFGRTFGDVSENPTGNKAKIVALIFAFALSLLMSFFMLNFNNDGIDQEGDFDTFRHGAWHGALLAIVIVIPVLVINGYFARSKWKSTLVHGLFWLLTLALMGGILDAMNHWTNISIPEG